MSASSTYNDYSSVINYFITKLCQIGACAAIGCLYWHAHFSLLELYRVTVQGRYVYSQGEFQKLYYAIIELNS